MKHLAFSITVVALLALSQAGCLQLTREDPGDGTVDIVADVPSDGSKGDSTPTDDGGPPDVISDVTLPPPPPNTCASAGDCVACDYPTIPMSPEECYCAECGQISMARSVCDYNRAAWTAMCSNVGVSCPDILCQQPPPVACLSDGTCGFDQGPPPQDDCNSHGECVQCAIVEAPQTVDDCDCLGCDTAPMHYQECDYNVSAWESVCAEWMQNVPCPAIDCIPDDGVQCNFATHQCIDVPSVDNSCESPGDCTGCAYPFEPNVEAECYCPQCPDTPVNLETCSNNQAAWQFICGDIGLQCSTIGCPPTMPITCGPGGVCTHDVGNPGGQCANDEDCVWCAAESAPTSPDDCKCQECGTVLSQYECETNTAAYATSCNAQAWPDQLDCVPQPCPPPPEPICNPQSYMCELGNFGDPGGDPGSP